MDDVITFRADPAKLPQGPKAAGFLLVIVFAPLLTALALYVVTFNRFETVSEFWNEKQAEIAIISCAGLVFGLAAMFRDFLTTRPRFTQRICLQLDRDGLTQSSQFRTRRWAWGDLPPFTYEAEQIPPNVAFHLPGQDPSDPRGGCIEDLYDSPLEEIAARLNAFRERALERAGSNTE